MQLSRLPPASWATTSGGPASILDDGAAAISQNGELRQRLVDPPGGQTDSTTPDVTDCFCSRCTDGIQIELELFPPSVIQFPTHTQEDHSAHDEFELPQQG